MMENDALEKNMSVSIEETKTNLSILVGTALLDATERLIESGQLSREDWGQIGYDAIYHRLKDELPDTDYPKLRVMHHKYKDRYEDKQIEKPLEKTNRLLEKAKRLAMGLKMFKTFFDKDSTSQTADRLNAVLRFLAIKTDGASIERLPLYSFHKFYTLDGKTRIAAKLNEIRDLMLQRSREIHLMCDHAVKVEIDDLTGEMLELNSSGSEGEEKKELKSRIKELNDFLELPGSLEITPRFRDSVVQNIIAAKMVSHAELNQIPDSIVFRISLQANTLEGYIAKEKLHVRQIDPDPAHLLTYAINATLNDPSIEEKSKLWYDFAVKSMGEQGARRFFEHVGYAMVTRFPLPSERTTTILLGNSDTGKGSTVGAVEKLFRFGEGVLYANATPQKLTDPNEHFSRQNLRNKLLITNGDLPHKRVRDMSPFNELTGGQSIEIEQKFHDPVNEIPIFKVLWASTNPLFKITVPGGFWRRIDLILMADVPQHERDKALKTKLLDASNGLFYNALMGLSYLVINDWNFTGEISDDEMEKLWNLYSDSVRVFADQYLIAEPSEIVIDGKPERNYAKEIPLNDLYIKYQEYCRKTQIEPVKPKAFSAIMGSDDMQFEIKKERIADSEKSAKVIYATYVDDQNNRNENTKNVSTKKESEQDCISWKAFVSQAPMILEPCSDSHEQSTHDARESKKEERVDHDLSHVRSMHTGIGTDIIHAQNLGKYGSDMGSKSVPILFSMNSPAQDPHKTNAQNLQTTMPDNIEQKKESIERPWKQPESGKSDSAMGKNENVTIDPHDVVLKMLINATYNSSKKYKTLTEIWDPACNLSREQAHNFLGELIRKGTVLREGDRYAAKDVLKGGDL